MRKPFDALLKASLLLFSMFGMIVNTGCAAMAQQKVKAGETARLDFTCRMPDGRVAYTTRQDIADRKEARASIFLPSAGYGPVELIAGDMRLAQGPTGTAREFEKEINYRLSMAMVGAPVGRECTVILKSEIVNGLSDSERFIRIGRTADFPKERKVKTERLRQDLGHEPVPGEQAFSMPGFTGVVKSVDGDSTIISVIVKDGYAFPHPYGQAVVRSYPDHYELFIETKVGNLVRTLGIVGRVTAVDDTSLTIDYGHPFGGEELTCDLLVESVLTPSIALTEKTKGEGK